MSESQHTVSVELYASRLLLENMLRGGATAAPLNIDNAPTNIDLCKQFTLERNPWGL